MPATGAKPAGAEDEAGAAEAVQQMFNSIAPRYDLLNHVLSANIDRLWWWRAARRFDAVLKRPDAAILDICCGTGDMTMALLKRRPQGSQPIVAGDFAHAMLSRGAKKFGKAARTRPNNLRKWYFIPTLARKERAQGWGTQQDLPYAIPVEADALHLPLKDGSLDLIVSAFGFRNLANYEAGLREFFRVLKPGGQLGILDFSEPGGLMGKAYAVYFRRVLPAIGRAICGQTGPYSYLPASVGNFPPPAEMQELMRSVGYVECSWQSYTFGIAGLYTARREA